MKKLVLLTLSVLTIFRLNAQCSFTVTETHTNVSCNGGSNGTVNLTVNPQSAKGLLISEIFTNPSGNDSPFEFIELVATTYIDFSVTPYTVICSSNGVANPQGWLSSAALTYAFQISSGTVSAGNVIYVGGSSMTPTTNVFRSLHTDTATGDGFVGAGNIAGILGNGGADADGVAIFNGTVGSLTGNSVPDDAIFFGSSIGTAFVNTTQGYQLPVNDHYTGGKLQTSSFLVAAPNQDEYLKATGTYNVETNTFTTPRTWTSTSTFTNLSTSITLSAFYTFTWSNAATTEDVAGLAAGNYTYTVSDGSCSLNGTVTITQPTAITATFSTGSVSCNGNSDGSATITPSGGTPGYTYLWSSGGTAATETNLPAGNYTCTVTDANGCVFTPTVNVTQPAVLTASCTTVSPSCNAGNNGSATAIPSGGTGPFTYAWAPTGGTNATATGLVSGNYTVTVTDSHSCTTTATVAVVDPAPLNTFISGFTNVSCNGGNDGTASTITSGGTPGYSYMWSPSGGNGAVGTGLSAGTYTCIIIDSHGCAATLTVNITQPPLLDGTISSTNVSCHGGTNGTATVAISGGNSPYTYSWSSGGTAATETGLSAGTYTVNVNDANLCVASFTVNITEPPTLLSGINTFTNPTCNGGNTGSATVNVIGGTPNYTYLWSPMGGTSATGTGLTAGTYTCVVTDANGCTTSSTVALTQPSAIVITSSTTNATCGFNDGTATASATGGNPGYTYLWSSGGNTPTVIGLFAGFYTVTVTDAIGCTNSQQVSVLNPNAPTITPFSNNVTCYGTTNGSAAVIASGGNPGYTYLWSTGATIPNVNSVGAGTYTITVTDQSSCAAFMAITITQPTQIVTTFTSTSETCHGGNNAYAVASTTGGVPNYTYAWSSGGTTTTETGLTAGTYTLTVTDANSCAVNSTLTITEPPAMAVTFTNVSPTCSSASNGSATAAISGGTSPYAYSWSSGGNAATENNLAAGIYTLTVTDANACSVSVTDTIVGLPLIALTTSSTGINCSYDSSGTATVIASGGTAPYTYSWSSGGTAATETGLTGGTYTVVVTDSLLCSSTTTVTVASPSPITISTFLTNNVCPGASSGTASITASGGTPGYTYSWSNGGTTASQTGLAAGTYTVSVRDANDCLYSFPITITEPPAITIATTITDASCNGGTNGGASIVASGGTPGYTYLWSTGSTTNSISNVAGGFYTVTVTDNSFCSAPFTITVTNPNAPNVSVVSTAESCNGGHTGAGVSTVTGGNPGYTYAWTPAGGNGANAFGLQVGNYTLTVTDQSGCQGYGMAIVTQPAPNWLHTLGPDTTICLPANPYTLCAPSIYTTYTWNTGATTACIQASTTNCYSVTVTDGNGCISTDTACLTFTSCVGIEEQQLSSFDVFPNPTSNQFNISLGSSINEADMEIYDARGKLMEKKIIHDKEVIDVSAYARGMYFIRINEEVKRIIVE